MYVVNNSLIKANNEVLGSYLDLRRYAPSSKPDKEKQGGQYMLEALCWRIHKAYLKLLWDVCAHEIKHSGEAFLVEKKMTVQTDLPKKAKKESREYYRII